MPALSEPSITINGHPLTVAQAMALRVAATGFQSEMGDADTLGDDEAGRQMVKGYRDRISEVLKIMLATSAVLTDQQAEDINRRSV